MIKIGDYAMHHMRNGKEGNLVLIISDKLENDKHKYGIEYVCVRKNGEVQGGGYSFSWPEEEFRPITDPCLIAASKVFEAGRLVKDFNSKAKDQEYHRDVWRSALIALQQADENKEVT